MRKKVVLEEMLSFGDYFGEISLIFNCLTTSTVASVTYSICAKLSKDVFEQIRVHAKWSYDDIVAKTFNYDDEWT